MQISFHSRTWQIVVGLALKLTTATAPALAQDPDRQQYALPALADEIAVEFQAIGRLGQAGFRTRQGCTATLIAPTVLITAAHCVSVSGQSNRVFVAGWSRGDYVAAGETALEIRHPAYAVDGEHRPDNDIALIVLESPIDDVDPIPLSVVQPQDLTGTKVALLGYHRQTPHLLSGRFDCPLEYFQSGLFLVGCPVVNGNSGSPILNRTDNGEWQVVGVVSSTLPGGAVAVELSDWLRHEVAAQQTQ